MSEVLCEPDVNEWGAQLQKLHERLARGERVPFFGLGTSMRPLYPSGSWHILKTQPHGAIIPGTIVLMYDEIQDDLKLHRLLTVGRDRWITQGDNCAQPDRPWQPQHYVATVMDTTPQGEFSIIWKLRRGWESIFAISPAYGRFLNRIGNRTPFRQVLQHLSSRD